MAVCAIPFPAGMFAFSGSADPGLIWGKPQTRAARSCGAARCSEGTEQAPLFMHVLALLPGMLDQICTFYDIFCLIPLPNNYCQILPVRAGSSFTCRQSLSKATFSKAAWLK